MSLMSSELLPPLEDGRSCLEKDESEEEEDAYLYEHEYEGYGDGHSEDVHALCSDAEAARHLLDALPHSTNPAAAREMWEAIALL